MRPNNPIFLIFLSVIAIPLSATASNLTRTPNIIFIVADYMGYSDTGPYGAKDIDTPALNKLAKQGIRFSDHYSAAPSCIPSRAAFMSGLYPTKVLRPFNSNIEIGLPSENNTLLKGLKAAGYSTGLVGKWHLGMENNFKPSDHGFDLFFGFNSWTLGYHNHLTSDGKPGLFKNDNLITEDGYLTDLFTEQAIQFIDNNANDPFFLYLAFNTGLPPYQGPNLPRAEWETGWDVNAASRSNYIEMVESMDQGINKVLEKLNALNLTDDTLVIFTYDHGGRHLVDSSPLFHGFGTLWEGGIRVPLIIRWPNQANSGVTISTPTIAMDLTATMLDVALQNSAINNLDGISLLDKRTDLKPAEERKFFWRRGKMKAVRQGSWKYVIDGNSQLLFNLDADIGERKNLFAQHPIIVNRLRDALAAWEISLNKK